MKSNYALYLYEREGFEIVESDKGFASYKIYPENKECYIRDIFVRKEFRKENVASKMADEITIMAKEHGCTHLTGSVDSTLDSSTISTKVLLAYGFKILKNNFSMIIFSKEI